MCALDEPLAELLPERASLRPALDHLDRNTDAALLLKESTEERRLWQDAGLYYLYCERPYDAIAVFSRLYERLCEEQTRQADWLAKGMPLVWISECHKALGNLGLSTRYLLLTAVSDAVRDKGGLNPNSGVYFRARWHRGWTDEDLQAFYRDCVQAFDARDPLCAFPEHILSRVKIPFTLPYARPAELDIYEVNRMYAGKLLARIDEKLGKPDGKDLEELAGYLLGSIPGFEVRSDVRTDDAQYDALIRNRGPKYDFRADLGYYALVECKDWSKPVGVPEVSQFINKLVLQDCRGGILFSSQGITGEGKNKDAELQLLKAHYRAGKIIMVMDKGDFLQATKGGNLVLLLQRKYEGMRFDIERNA